MSDEGSEQGFLEPVANLSPAQIEEACESAVANAHQKRQDVDVDRLFVMAAFVDGGPSLKRIRPAPMGRAFRILKRTCHVTIGLGEHRPATPAMAGKEGAAGAPAGRRTVAGRPRASARAARAGQVKATTATRRQGKAKKRGS